MKGISSISLAAVLSALVAQGANAQWNVARFAGSENRVYATFGLDPALVSSLGYGRVVSIVGHNFQFAGEAGVATADLDASDFRVLAGVQTSLVRWRSLHATGSVMGSARGTENTIYRGYNFGADFKGSLGLYRPGWFVAGELGKNKAVITHVTHTDWYRTYFYPGAKDGWYLNAGGTLHYGVAGGLGLGRVELVGRVGLLTTENFKDVMPPMYASFGLGVGF